MCLLDDLLGLLSIKVFLIKSKSVEGLVIRCLVPTEPLANTRKNSIRNIINVVVFSSKRIIGGDSNDLPVKFSIVNHCDASESLDFNDAAAVDGLGANLDNIDGIVISKDLELGVLLIGVLPSLGKASVVPEDGAVVVPELSLLDVLGDRVVLLLGGNLHLSLGVLGNLYNHVVCSVLSLEGNVVPGGDYGIVGLETEAVGLSLGLSCYLGAVGVEDGGNGVRTGGAEGGGG
mmetsp:Transcript_23214/g.34623  ORF Transcript_23214/g.34623 Transcript_23214/m.34623 type:complete len:232 (-) Transcript_23214:251-946(-)